MAHARETIERFYRILDKGSYDELRDVISAECVLRRPGVDLPPGPEAFIQWVGAFMRALPDHRHQLSNWIESGDGVAYEVEGTGTFTAPLETPQGPVPPTGRSLAFRSGGISRVRDGKLVYDAFYFDQLDMLTQLGLMPAPAGA